MTELTPTESALLAELIAQAGSRKLKYLPFWGHTPSAPGAIDKSCLSQWYPLAFELDGIRYATAEHYMMMRKALLFGDTAIAAQIIQAGNPAEAKKLGRQIANYDEARWRAARFDVVTQGNLAKFAQNPAHLAYLLDTRERVLVEASPVDAIWGIGLAADHPHIEQPARWKGPNLLGFALMQAREQLRKG